MYWVKLTRTNRGRYDGPMWIDADKLLAMQRVSDERGAYTVLFTAVPDTSADEFGNAPGGFEGFDVREVPEDIMAMLDAEPAPEQMRKRSPASVRFS